MTGLTKAGIESQLLLSRPIGETLEALFEIGIVITKTGPRRHRHHHTTQVGPLKHSRSAARRESIEIQQPSAASLSQHAPKLPQASRWISPVSYTHLTLPTILLV